VRYGLRRIGVTAVTCLLLAACGSDDDGAIELPDEPVTSAAPAEDDEFDDGGAEGDAGQSDEDQLYPPLPPLEPDPDSDIPEEEQRFFLERYEEYHRIKNTALATGAEGDPLLDTVAAHEELEALRSTLEGYAERGVVLSFAGSRVDWVRVVSVEGASAIVQECRVEGPASGRVDAETGEAIGERTPGDVARLLQARFELAEQEDGTFEHRVVEFLSAEDEAVCRA
jgi:hypothetical protein